MTNQLPAPTPASDELNTLRQRVAELETLTTAVEQAYRAQILDLQQQRDEFELAQRLSLDLHKSLNFETVLDFVLELVAQVIKFDAAAVLLPEKPGHVRIFRWEGYSQKEIEVSFFSRTFSSAKLVVLQTMQATGTPFLNSNVQEYDEWTHASGNRWVKSHLSAPLRINSKSSGFIRLDGATPGLFTHHHARLLTCIAGQVGSALANASQLAATHTEAVQRVRSIKNERNFVSAILNSESALVLVLNPAGRILRTNRGFEKATGYTNDEVRQKKLTDFFAPTNELDSVDTILRRLSPQQTAARLSGYWITQGGGQKIISWSFSALANEAGAIEFIIGTGVDVTDQRQLEDRLLAIHYLGRELNLMRDEQEICKIALETAAFLLDLKSSGYGIVSSASQQLDYVYYPRRGFPHIINAALSLNTADRIEQLAQKRQALEPKSGATATKSLYPTEQFWLSAPMQAQGVVIGVLDVESHQPNHFSEEDQQLLRTLADQTAAAIENARLHRETQQRVDELTTLSLISQAINSTLDLEETLTLITNHAIRLLDAEAASVALCDDATGEIRFRAVSGGAPELIRTMRLPAGQGVVGWVIKHAQPVLIANVLTDSRFFKKFDEITGFTTRSLICVPLLSNKTATGAIEVINKTAGSFTGTDLQLLAWLATTAAIAIQNARLFQQVQLGHHQLQSLSRRLVSAQETERRRIARELHDEAGQALTSLMMGLRVLEQEAANPENAVKRIIQLRQITNDISENLHRLAIDLRPASLDYLGLVAALRQYIKKFRQQTNIVVEFEASELEAIRLPSAAETNLYRVVQEALTNVARHAQASHVDVLLERHGPKIIVIVEDNGIGFDAQSAGQKERLGLLGIRERTEMMNGQLTVESSPGSGTTILVEVPYDD